MGRSPVRRCLLAIRGRRALRRRAGRAFRDCILGARWQRDTSGSLPNASGRAPETSRPLLRHSGIVRDRPREVRRDRWRADQAASSQVPYVRAARRSIVSRLGRRWAPPRRRPRGGGFRRQPSWSPARDLVPRRASRTRPKPASPTTSGAADPFLSAVKKPDSSPARTRRREPASARHAAQIQRPRPSRARRRSQQRQPQAVVAEAARQPPQR